MFAFFLHSTANSADTEPGPLPTMYFVAKFVLSGVVNTEQRLQSPVLVVEINRRIVDLTQRQGPAIRTGWLLYQKHEIYSKST